MGDIKRTLGLKLEAACSERRHVSYEGPPTLVETHSHYYCKLKVDLESLVAASDTIQAE